MKLRASILEFLAALTDPRTYSFWQNTEAMFGFLWGLPVPLFALTIHVYAAHMPRNVASIVEIVSLHPMYWVFLVHPFLFAVIFGALGAMRQHRDEQIGQLVSDVKKQCEELCVANSRLLETDRLKTEFLANVTHELKSPLVTALGYTDRILGRHLGDVTERQEKALEVGKRNLIRLRTLIDEILDFSRLDSGKAKFEMAPVNLGDAISVAVENLTLKAAERKIELHKSLPSDPAWMLGDLQKLTQVVTNLLDNAIKFSHPNGMINAKLTAGGGTWHLTIEDHGQGIPAAAQPKLFERFVQADGSLGRPYNGVGLGLVIVKKIVEQHGGQIWIESTENVGTKVHVQMPVGNAPANRAATGINNDERREVAYATHSAH